MSIVVWCASAMVAASIPVAGLALAAGRPSNRRASLNLIDLSPTLRQAELERSPIERVLLPVTRGVGTRLVHLTPTGWVESRRRLVARAGLSGRLTAEQILGAKLLLPAIVVAGFSLRLGGGGGSTRLMLVLVVATVAAFLAPDLLVRARADRRAEAISTALPDMLDQVTISVEAGLGFEQALARSSEGHRHPLAEELLRMLQDVRLGATRSSALRALADRSQVDDLKSVVLTLRQADALGVPLARTLRTAANEMREKRRFRAEARAQRLSTLLIFPLGLCILPALFIVILGPAMVGKSLP